MDFLIQAARNEPGVKRLILFGSRARGDARERSDYDVAVEWVEKDAKTAWSAWSQDVQEKIPTLCGLDLVRMGSKASREFLDRIQKEGKTLYERP